MMKFDRDTFRINEASGLGRIMLSIGALGLVLSLIGVGIQSQREQAYYSLLVSWTFWLTIAFGALFFVMVHHLTNSTWSVVIRRILEAIMTNLPFIFLLVVLFVVPFLGLKSLYGWTKVPETDHLMHAKTWWLNEPFFWARAAVYVVVTFLLTRKLYQLSIRQDKEPSEKLTNLMKNVSGPGLVLFALTFTFSAFDYLMSLDYRWYSTIFGVYVFAGCVISVLSFTTVVVYFLRTRGILEDVITVEHYHDLGKLVFAFTVFWAYIAFSQFFLIWYGNIPEETDWYVRRFAGSWGNMGFVILFGHFIIPFLILISRVPKRRPKVLVAMCFYMLFMHWVDVHWLIMPNFHADGVSISWLDVTSFIGVGGIFLGLFWSRLTSNPVIPIKDPRLSASIHFTNV